MPESNNDSHFKITATNSNTRIGELNFGSKTQPTPSSLIQNSIGGGAGAWYRMITYTDLLPVPMPVLLTYFNAGGFDKSYKSSVKEIAQYGNINSFILHKRDEFFQKKYHITDYEKTKLNWDPVTILDSGSGQFLSKQIKNKSSNQMIEDYFKKIISKYFEFCAKHEFNIMIALDYAGKYTHKDKEKENPDYDKIVSQFGTAANLQLLSESLHQMESQNYDFLVYATIHGNGPKEMKEFTENVFELERTKKFGGLAIGGIAGWSKDDDELWNIPKFSGGIQKGIKLGRAVKLVRKLLDEKDDTRPIHVLGAGGIKNIIPLVFAGTDTFDNVTPWRRSTDGSRKVSSNVSDPNAKGSFSRYLIPLLDNNGEVIKDNKENVLDYVKLNKRELDDVVCNCHICTAHTLQEIRQLYSSNNNEEDFFFAEILCYIHAKNQYQSICNRLRRDVESGQSVSNVVEEITDQDLKTNLQQIIDSI